MRGSAEQRPRRRGRRSYEELRRRLIPSLAGSFGLRPAFAQKRGGRRMELAETLVLQLWRVYLEKQSSIAYRYCPDLAQKARDHVHDHYRDFVAHHGGDLVVFPDGLSLAAAEQKRMRALFSERSEETVADVMKRHGLRNPWPKLQFPDEFLKHRNGIAAFFNADEGEEYLLDFNHVLSAFRKQGTALNDDEASAIRGMVESQSISPAFVRRLIYEHRCEAIGRAFMIRDFNESPHLEWLLRRFKGRYYRKRYPTISFAQSAES